MLVARHSKKEKIAVAKNVEEESGKTTDEVEVWKNFRHLSPACFSTHLKCKRKERKNINIMEKFFILKKFFCFYCCIYVE